MTIGSLHTTLFRDLAGSPGGLMVTRSFSEKPYVYTHIAQLQRHFMFNKSKPVERNLLAKAYIEVLSGFACDIAFEEHEKLSRSEDYNLYVRDVSDNFSYEDVENMFDIVKAGDLTINKFNEILRSKGIAPIPRTDADIHARAEGIRAEILRKAGIVKRAHLGR
jgi:hypothetical protein